VTNVVFGRAFRRALLEAGRDAPAINLVNLGDRLHGLHLAISRWIFAVARISHL
jgi:hypothetical protein